MRFAFDEAVLRERLEPLLEQAYVEPAIEVMVGDEPIERSFAYQRGQSLELDAAIEQIQEHLASPDASRVIRLEMIDTTDPDMRRPSMAAIEEQVNILSELWESENWRNEPHQGVAGVYLYDLETGETLTRNADTVFSAASVMKVAILLHAYISLDEFTPEVQEAIEAMIVESDNLRANDVLAASMDGSGTDDAYVGVLTMNKMLSDLGFEHTYMNMPYEGYDYLVGTRGIDIRRGPAQEGLPPYTEADPILRTTPAEISRLFLMINECSEGEGMLLARFPQQLSAERCQEMLDLLARNADDTRMVAPIPDDVRVEHKSGWVQDMHADVGIVRSPGGDYLLAVYLWSDVVELPDVWANPYMVAFSRLIYTAYNPEEL
jgi:beta-lactamase class A